MNALHKMCITNSLVISSIQIITVRKSGLFPLDKYSYTLSGAIMQVTKFKVNGNIIVSQRFNDKYEEMILFYLLCTMDITYIKIFHEI